MSSNKWLQSDKVSAARESEQGHERLEWVDLGGRPSKIPQRPLCADLRPLHCAFQSLLYWRKQTLRIDFSEAEKCPFQTLRVNCYSIDNEFDVEH
jgi:hypothetical protein